MSYCDIQENCRELKSAIAQYEEVVKQNRSLQADVKAKDEELRKYREAIIKLVTTIYEVYGNVFDDELNAEIEEFLMVEKEKSNANDRRN